MPQGLITSLLIKLTFDFWYLALIALLIKLALIRYTVTNELIKVILIWLLGSIAFYFLACILGIVFSSLKFIYIPFVMYAFSSLAEIGFSSVIFRISAKRLWPSIVLGNGLFFTILFIQMLN